MTHESSLRSGHARLSVVAMERGPQTAKLGRATNGSSNWSLTVAASWETASLMRSHFHFASSHSPIGKINEKTEMLGKLCNFCKHSLYSCCTQGLKLPPDCRISSTKTKLRALISPGTRKLYQDTLGIDIHFSLYKSILNFGC